MWGEGSTGGEGLRAGVLTGDSEEPGPLRPAPAGLLPPGWGPGRSRFYWPTMSSEQASLSEPQVLSQQMGKMTRMKKHGKMHTEGYLVEGKGYCTPKGRAGGFWGCLEMRGPL